MKIFDRSRRGLFAIVMLAAAVAAACGDPMTTSDFDASAWQAQRGVAPKQNRRAALLPALQPLLQAGMSREQVRGLLGEPDRTRPDADIYQMGIAPFGIDIESYLILYDQAGKLKAHRLQRG